MQPKTGATRVRGDEARSRLIEATITLMKELPFPRVTVRKIAEVAGLSTSTLLWNYHTVEGLFGAVVAELDARSEEWVRAQSAATVGFDQYLVLRTQLVAWMALSGMDTASVDTPIDGLLNNALQQRIRERTPVSGRTARVFAMIELFTTESVILMRDVHTNWSDDDFQDGIALFDQLRSLLPVAEGELGWSEPSTPSPAPDRQER